MSHLSRAVAYGKQFVLDRQFRGRVLSTLDRYGRTTATAAAPLEEQGRTAFLRGRRIFAAAGCEVTFLLDHLSSLGMETAHTYADGRAMDPLTELTTPGTRALSERWDYYLLSIAQVVRLPFWRLQTGGMAYSRQELEQDTEVFLDVYRRSIEIIREKSAAPIFLFSYVLSYRPSLGIHEYRSLKDGASLVEFLHAFHLKLYEIARRSPGVYVLDVNLALEGVGKDATIDPETSSGIHDHVSREGGRHLGRHLVQHFAVLEPSIRRVKCAVFDLDGTLWNGVLREDGPAGVTPRAYYLDVMLLLAARGILLAICSKNDVVEMEHLPALLGEDLFPKIVSRHLSWEPKSVVLKNIAEELNIGLDSLAFFDDSPFERAEVGENAPGVLVLTPEDIYASPTRPEFHPLGEVTPEALTRTTKYQQQAARKHAELLSARGLDPFLKSCELKLSLKSPSEGDMPRVFELLQRTNQLNATLTRTSLEQLREYAAHPEKYTMRIARLSDRFGDYGLIGFASCEKSGQTWQLLDLALSCRALGRGVERALVNHLGALARAEGAAAQVLRFLPGPRNQQMFETLKVCGFGGPECSTLAEGKAVDLTRPLGPHADVSYPEWLSVTEPA